MFIQNHKFRDRDFAIIQNKSIEPKHLFIGHVLGGWSQQPVDVVQHLDDRLLALGLRGRRRRRRRRGLAAQLEGEFFRLYTGATF